MLKPSLNPSAPMPDPRPAGSPLLPEGKGERFYLEQFMAKFGAESNDTHIMKAATGLHDLAISRQMFEDHLTGKSKIAKRGRSPYLLLLADCILDPDEIRLHQGSLATQSIYILSRFLVRSKPIATLAVFREDGLVWNGWSGFHS